MGSEFWINASIDFSVYLHLSTVQCSWNMEYRRVSLMMNSGVKIAMKALYVTIENKAMYKSPI